MPTVQAAFEFDILSLDVNAIVPIKTLSAADRKTETYRRIAASISHIGLIEPLVVYPSSDGKYSLLDGHIRLDILIASGVTTAPCLLATDNETYTYNKKVNYISPIARHYMILRALANVSEERIAAALNVKVSAIRERRDLLNGICAEAIDLLRDQRVNSDAFAALRKMRPVRQIDAARLMFSARKFTGKFARALLDGTNAELLVSVPSKPRNVAPEDQSMMEHETDEMLRHIRDVEATYGNDVLMITTSCRYIEKLLTNTRIRRYLAKHHAESLGALDQVIADTAGISSGGLPSSNQRARKWLLPGDL